MRRTRSSRQAATGMCPWLALSIQVPPFPNQARRQAGLQPKSPRYDSTLGGAEGAPAPDAHTNLLYAVCRSYNNKYCIYKNN
jgi:hypothetical protein